MKYVHYFENESGYNTVRKNDYEEPWLSLIEGVERVNYNISERDYMDKPLTFEILTAGTIEFINHIYRFANWTHSLEYSLNGGSWTVLAAGEEGYVDGSYDYYVQGDVLSVSAGDVVQFRGYDEYSDNWDYSDHMYGGWGLMSGGCSWNHHFTTTCNFNVSGNVMSLINPVHYTTMYNFNDYSERALEGLFSYCEGLIDASELILPARMVDKNCYLQMFNGCTSLVNAPRILPATLLGEYCYSDMFAGCTSLVSAPKLPAMNLADNCYSSMFNGCTSLVNAPELPATTLVTYCYYSMFQGCSSLVKAPDLLAPVLEDSCYYNMFFSCTRLNYLKCMATSCNNNTSVNFCLSYWIDDTSETGTFVKNPNTPASFFTSSTSGNSLIPSGWTIVDA